MRVKFHVQWVKKENRKEKGGGGNTDEHIKSKAQNKAQNIEIERHKLQSEV